MASQPKSCAFKLFSPQRQTLFLECLRIIYNTYTGNVVSIADPLWEQPVPDLPGEDAGALPLVVADLVHHPGGRHPGLGASDGAGLDWACLVISRGEMLSWKDVESCFKIFFSPSKYLWDASIGDLEYPGDVAWPGALMSQLHNLLSGGVWQRPAIDIDPSQLIDPAVAWKMRIVKREREMRIMTQSSSIPSHHPSLRSSSKW